MPGIGVITNPHSRRNRKRPKSMRRLAYMLGHNDAYELTNRIEDIAHVAQQFKDSGIDILALNGGDGTNHVTLTKFIEVYGDTPLPHIAILRGGTMNTVSNALGISGTPHSILGNLVDKYYDGDTFETTSVPLLKITDDTGTRYGFIFGNGIVSNFLEEYYDTGNPSPTTAAILLARGIASVPAGGSFMKKLFRPFHAAIETDETHIPAQDYMSVLASTVEQIGLGFRPFIRCREQIGAFHLLGITGGAFDVISQLPRIRMGLPIQDNVARSVVTSRAIFRSDSPVIYTIDGDMHTARDGELILETGPNLTLIIR